MRRLICTLPLLFGIGCAHHGLENKSVSPPLGSTPLASAPRYATTAPAQRVRDTACAAQSVRVHFDFDSALLRDDDRGVLERSAHCLASNHALRVVIAGNADERGTEEYNLALGDRRAGAVARYLESLGVAPAQLRTVSYGKERPLCSEHDEACWSKNRRAALDPGAHELSGDAS
jgi:peptidoglycan-associated lipoprotein